MSKNEWITDRLPTDDDGDTKGYVWVTDNDGSVGIMGWEFAAVRKLAWMPIVAPEPYVEPKRYRIDVNWSGYTVYDTVTQQVFADNIHSKEAAERIAAIYEEVMP